MNMMTSIASRSPRQRAARLARIFSRFDRADLALAAELSIELMDRLEPDPDLEPEEDMCLAGDDNMVAGPVMERGRWLDNWQHTRTLDIGAIEDGEPDEPRGRRQFRDRLRSHGYQPQRFSDGRGGSFIRRYVRAEVQS
jgi:hypothetical protein